MQALSSIQFLIIKAGCSVPKACIKATFNWEGFQNDELGLNLLIFRTLILDFCSNVKS